LLAPLPNTDMALSANEEGVEDSPKLPRVRRTFVRIFCQIRWLLVGLDDWSIRCIASARDESNRLDAVDGRGGTDALGKEGVARDLTGSLDNLLTVIIASRGSEPYGGDNAAGGNEASSISNPSGEIACDFGVGSGESDAEDGVDSPANGEGDSDLGMGIASARFMNASVADSELLFGTSLSCVKRSSSRSPSES